MSYNICASIATVVAGLGRVLSWRRRWHGQIRDGIVASEK